MEDASGTLNRLLIEMAPALARFAKAFNRAIDHPEPATTNNNSTSTHTNNNTVYTTNARASPRSPYPSRSPSPIVGGTWGTSRIPSPHSPIPHELLSPPVIRRYAESVVEVRFDMRTLAGRPSDTWSNYSMDSNDETMCAGLTPDSSPQLSRKVNGNPTDATNTADLPGAAATSDEAAPALSTFVSPTNVTDADDLDRDERLLTFRSGLTVCEWEHSAASVEAEKTLLTGVPNLGRWLHEYFLPFDVESQLDFFVLDAITDSSAFDAGGDATSTTNDGDDCLGVPPPGAGIIDLLGTDFEPCDDPSGLAWERLPLQATAGQRQSISTSPPMSMSRLSIASPSVRTLPQAINYDYAMAFPRTHADVPNRPQAMNVVSRFLSYPAACAKSDYDWDVEYGLLNHALPKISNTKPSACESCQKTLESVSVSRLVHCRYCARIMCKKCCDRRFVIPSYVIVKGDFEAHAICQPCENHLQKHLHTPCIEFNRMTQAAIKSIGKTRIEAIRTIRDEGLRLLYYHILPDCPSRHSMISLIPQNITPYLSVYPDSVGARLSLADLCELQTQYPLRAMSQVVQLFANHVERCPLCSTVTRTCCGGDYCAKKGKVAPPRARRGGLGSKSASKSRLFSSKVSASRLFASTHLPPANGLADDLVAGVVPFSPLEGTGPPEDEDNEDADWSATTTFSPYRAPVVTSAIAATGKPLAVPVADGTELLPDDASVLCRTCSEYCHAECYLPDETQCRRCAAEIPDVMPFVRHYSKRSFGDESALLWDCCEEDWFGMDELSQQKRDGKRRASVVGRGEL
jgi:hypothetical protein